MAIALPDARELSDEVLEALRLSPCQRRPLARSGADQRVRPAVPRI